MHIRKLTCLLLLPLFFLCLLPPGLADERPYHVTVEIIPLGPYPDSALPPGEAGSEEKIVFVLGRRCITAVSATTFRGWVFLGWQFEKSVLDLNGNISTSVESLPEGLHYTTGSVEIAGDTTVQAIFAYAGDIPAFDALSKNGAPAQPSDEDTESFAVGVYERNAGGKDGDYGTLLCYPNEFSKDMTVQDGSTILLAAIPDSNNRFSHWSVYKEAENGQMTLLTRSDAALLVLKIDAPHSIDAVFVPAKKR